MLSPRHLWLPLWCIVSIARPADAAIKAASISINNTPLLIAGFENDIVFRHIGKTGEWDMDVVEIARALCHSGNENIFDIGANLGYMSLQFAFMAPRGQVFSWEPHPSNYKLLDMNINNNNILNVRTFNNAVADEDYTICIPRFIADNPEIPATPGEDPTPGLKRPSNNGDVKLTDWGSNETTCTGRQVAIKTMQLSEIAPELRSLDFVKIGIVVYVCGDYQMKGFINFFEPDVQGYELRVLKSALPLIMQHRPYVVIEFEEWNMKRMKQSYTTVDLVRYIRNVMHYDVFLISNDYPADHLLVPNEKVSRFRNQFSSSIKPLVKPNSVNRNVEAGVKEQICLQEAKCNHWKYKARKHGK